MTEALEAMRAVNGIALPAKLIDEVISLCLGGYAS